MPDFINASGFAGNVISSGSSDVTGSLFGTLLLIVIILIFLALAFRISMEYVAILITPLLIVLMAFYSEWYAIGGVFLILLAVIFARNFFIQPR